ncbi:hypothetical protein J3B02_005521, partial [Coemansia erecta]
MHLGSSFNAWHQTQQGTLCPNHTEQLDETDDRLEHLRAGVRIVTTTMAAPDGQSPAAETEEARSSSAETPFESESGSYPLPALFQRQSLPESAWEPDDSTVECRQCTRRFTLFLRRHHCRRCGLLFCVNCSSKRAQLASPTGPKQLGYYATPQLQDDENTPLAMLRQRGREDNQRWRFQEHRVCDACAQAVEQLEPAAADSSVVVVAADGLSTDVSANAHNIFRDPGTLTAGTGHQRSHSSGTAQPSWRTTRARASTSSIRACPVCDRDWATIWNLMRRVPGEGWQEAQERHIRSCIEDTSAEMQGGTRHDGLLAEPSGNSSSAVPTDSSQPRRSTGFLGFFERNTPAPAAIAVSNASANAASSAHHHAGSAPASGAATTRAARSPMGVRYVAYQLTGDTPLLGE